ncbi:hypothetical protein B0H13DRAFT_2357317 [Mycena leptocephala]|nr:hypothetical protein B0H13DRAFT_2357317 [Mycena leptocephala]
MTSLPNELFVAIAAAGQEGRFVDSNTAFDFKFKSEWTLSHLCRRFRESIVGAPELWTHVEIDLNMRRSVEIFNLYLERCGTYPISVTLQYFAAPNYHLVDKRLRQIVPHMGRIWRLSIRLRTHVVRLVLAPFRDVAAPNLRHLEIINKLSYQWSFVETPITGASMDDVPNPPRASERSGPRRFFSRRDHSPLRGHEAMPLVGSSISQINWELRSGLRFCIPSLKFLHLSLLDNEPRLHLLGAVDLFDTPALTELTVSGASCGQIWELLSYGLDCASFPVLTSFSSVNRGPCPCRTDDPIPGPKSPQPGQFTALTSITLINQCLSASFVRGISDPLSQPWPRLKTVTLCPQNGTLDAVQTAIRDAVESHQQEGQPLPKFRLSPELFALVQDWDKDVEVEMFDPTEIVKSLR